jgi:AraC-like DNA-binding protein
MSSPRANVSAFNSGFARDAIHPHGPRTRVFRGRAESVAWELWLRAALPEHAGLVAGLWAGDADTLESRHRMIPDGELWLMFNLGPPQRVVSVDHAGAGAGGVHRGAMICGLHDRPVAFESVERHPRVVTVRLLPRGACAVFGGLSLLELANRVFDLEAVLGRAAGVERLQQRAMEAPALGTALDLVEEWLADRLRKGPQVHALTRTALDILGQSRGTVRVEAVARNLGVSARYLNGLFQRQVGLPAKSLSRVLRFQRALDLLDLPGTPDFGRLALDCGYYDQSHLNRDFRELVGLTPGEYVARVFRAPGWREIGG